MKKTSLLTSVVAGIFLAGCGENLPKEITSHENFKSCQQVEKNLLTIQSSFEKDERVKFYTDCNQYFNEPMMSSYKDIMSGGDAFNKTIKAMENDRKAYNIVYKSINELFLAYAKKDFTEAQKNARYDNFSK